MLWMKKNYPSFPLWHADHVFGSLQDVCENTAKHAFWNVPRYIEFIDTILRHKDKDNKLEESLFECLSSAEISGMLRAMSIVSICIVDQMHWLSAHKNDLSKNNWINRNISKFFDMLEQALLYVLDEPLLLKYKDFMMNVFNATVCVPPEFKEFYQCKCNEKTQRVIGSNGKVAPYELLINESFDPMEETNKETNRLIENIATRLCSTFFKELWDTKKTTVQHLSSKDG